MVFQGPNGDMPCLENSQEAGSEEGSGQTGGLGLSGSGFSLSHFMSQLRSYFTLLKLRFV